MKTKRINSRKKGVVYEQKIRREFIDLGFDKCQTARYESKMIDDSKVDLTNTVPFNIQCKAVEKNLKYQEILESMPEDPNYNVILHKKNRKGELVIMTKEDFYELIQMLKTNKII